MKIRYKSLSTLIELAFLIDDDIYVDRSTDTVCYVERNGWITCAYFSQDDIREYFPVKDLKHITRTGIGDDRKFSYNKHWTP